MYFQTWWTRSETARIRTWFILRWRLSKWECLLEPFQGMWRVTGYLRDVIIHVYATNIYDVKAAVRGAVYQPASFSVGSGFWGHLITAAHTPGPSLLLFLLLFLLLAEEETEMLRVAWSPSSVSITVLSTLWYNGLFCGPFFPIKISSLKIS